MSESVVYECVKCGTRQTLKELEERTEFKCISCGHRVLKKIRPPIVTRIKTCPVSGKEIRTDVCQNCKPRLCQVEEEVTEKTEEPEVVV